MGRIDPAILAVIIERVRDSHLDCFAAESELDTLLQDCRLFGTPEGRKAARSLDFLQLLDSWRNGEPLPGDPWEHLGEVTTDATTTLDVRAFGIRLWLMCFDGMQPDGTISLECVYKDMQPEVRMAERAAFAQRIERWCELMISLGEAFGARAVEVPRITEPGEFVIWQRDPNA